MELIDQQSEIFREWMAVLDRLENSLSAIVRNRAGKVRFRTGKAREFLRVHRNTLSRLVASNELQPIDGITKRGFTYGELRRFVEQNYSEPWGKKDTVEGKVLSDLPIVDGPVSAETIIQQLEELELLFDRVLTL